MAKNGLSKLAQLVLEESENEKKLKDEDNAPMYRDPEMPSSPILKHLKLKTANVGMGNCENNRTGSSQIRSGTTSFPMAAELPLDIAIMDKAAIGSENDDAETATSNTADCDNDLIHFSDSETEIDNDQPPRDSAMLM